MKIGLPKEIKPGETRVALGPDEVARLVKRGHVVQLQRGAGSASGWSDSMYREAGARVVRDLQAVYRHADLICKVKEPQRQELSLMRSGQLIFTFLHLAGNPKLLRALLDRKAVGIAYETITARDGSLPILAPMSEIAGRVAVQLGGDLLRRDRGGKGILLTGVPGAQAGTVGIIGAGHVGQGALQVAHGLGAHVVIADINPRVLRALNKQYGRGIKTVRATESNIAKLVKSSDLLIGAVLVSAQRAPQVVTRSMVRAMQAGSVIIDVHLTEINITSPTGFEAIAGLGQTNPRVPYLDLAEKLARERK